MRFVSVLTTGWMASSVEHSAVCIATPIIYGKYLPTSGWLAEYPITKSPIFNCYTHLGLGTGAAEERLRGEGRCLDLLLRGVPLQAEVQHRGPTRRRGPTSGAQRRESVGEGVGGGGTNLKERKRCLKEEGTD